MDEKTREKAARWRDRWLYGIKLAPTYDMEAHEKAAEWAVNWNREVFISKLDGMKGSFDAGPF